MFEGEFLREEDECGNAPAELAFSLLGWLKIEFGPRVGKDIYERLRQAAETACVYQGIGGKPGILFNNDGGAFVSLDD
jgi:hypothetical protein